MTTKKRFIILGWTVFSILIPLAILVCVLQIDEWREKIFNSKEKIATFFSMFTSFVVLINGFLGFILYMVKLVSHKKQLKKQEETINTIIALSSIINDTSVPEANKLRNISKVLHEITYGKQNRQN